MELYGEGEYIDLTIAFKCVPERTIYSCNVLECSLMARCLLNDFDWFMVEELIIGTRIRASC